MFKLTVKLQLFCPSAHSIEITQYLYGHENIFYPEFRGRADLGKCWCAGAIDAGGFLIEGGTPIMTKPCILREGNEGWPDMRQNKYKKECAGPEGLVCGKCPL